MGGKFLVSYRLTSLFQSMKRNFQISWWRQLHLLHRVVTAVVITFLALWFCIMISSKHFSIPLTAISFPRRIKFHHLTTLCKRVAAAAATTKANILRRISLTTIAFGVVP